MWFRGVGSQSVRRSPMFGREAHLDSRRIVPRGSPAISRVGLAKLARRVEELEAPPPPLPTQDPLEEPPSTTITREIPGERIADKSRCSCAQVITLEEFAVLWTRVSGVDSELKNVQAQAHPLQRRSVIQAELRQSCRNAFENFRGL